MVDTFPIRVEKPKERELRYALYSGKYGTTVYKVQLGVTFRGHIVLCTGPHLPGYDAHIWERTAEAHPREPWELWLGDGHYSSVPNFLVPFRKDRLLTNDEWMVNTIISHYRARTEHVNAFFVRHAMFRNRFRGSVDLLYDAVHTTAHMTAIHLHQYPRYAPYGAWPHYTPASVLA